MGIKLLKVQDFVLVLYFYLCMYFLKKKSKEKTMNVLILDRDFGSHNFAHNDNSITQQGIKIKFLKNWCCIMK